MLAASSASGEWQQLLPTDGSKQLLPAVSGRSSSLPGAAATSASGGWEQGAVVLTKFDLDWANVGPVRETNLAIGQGLGLAAGSQNPEIAR